MRKFRGVMLGMVMGALVFGLTGCISAPPEQSATTTGTQETLVVSETASAQTTQEAATAVPVEQQGAYKVVAKAAAGEFTPTDEMKKVMAGDVSTLGFNQIYVTAEDDQAVADALKAGHFYISAAESAPKIQIKGKDLIMGDSVSMANEKLIKVEVADLKSGSVIKVINQTGVVEEKKVMGEKYDTRVTLDSEGFCFVEVWAGDGTLVAITNPMYVKP
ncbi:MAG: hypothetical protein ACRCW2_08970 [Cellulosilyticaceae bacterium]